MNRHARVLASIALAAALLQGDPTHAAGDTALRLINASAATTGYIRVPNSTAFALQTFTLEAWVQRIGNGYGNTTDGGGAGILAKCREGAVGTHIVSWHMDWTNTGQMIFDLVHTYASSGVYVGTAPVADPLARHHLAASFDGATIRLYVDGALAASAPWTLGTVYYGGEDVLIGANNFGSGFLRRFDGHIDDVRIWDHARTADQIASSMNCQLGGHEPGLVGYWPFADSTLHDATGHGHDGVSASLGGAVSFGAMASLGSCLTSADGGPAHAADGLALSVFPQPARDRFTVAFDLPDVGDAKVELLDVAGRRLAEWDVPAGAGRRRLTGSLREIRSPGAANGVLFVRVRAGGRTAVRPLVTVK